MGYIELLMNFSEDKNFGSFVEVLKVFGMCYGQIICTCTYDKDVIDLGISDNGLEVKMLTEKSPFIRVIKCKELIAEIDCKKILKDFLEISNNYDVMLLIVLKYKSNVEVIINDNGHDYIGFDEKEYPTKTVKREIKKIITK